MKNTLKAFSFTESDIAVLHELRELYGLGSDTDTVRLALRQAVRVARRESGPQGGNDHE
jgi:Arc/MetJ family transcription regulator